MARVMSPFSSSTPARLMIRSVTVFPSRGTKTIVVRHSGHRTLLGNLLPLISNGTFEPQEHWIVTGDFMPKSLAALPVDITIGLDERTNGLWSGRSYGNACVLGWRRLP